MRYWKSNYFEKFINNLNIRKYITHKGWLEFCTDSEIIGWVYVPEKELKVIRLIYQNRILAEAPICEERYDVQEELSIGVPTGFRLPISNLNEKTDIDQLLFEVSDGEDTNYVKLQFLKKYKNLRILKPQNNKNSILEGNIDGYETINSITGWVYNSNGENIVWLQSDNQNPIKILCNKFREDLVGFYDTNNCGFELYISELSSSYFNKEIWFTFDKEGLNLVPQIDEIIILNKIDVSNSEEDILEGSDSDSSSLENYKEIQEMFSELDSFKNILDEIEINVDKKISSERKFIMKFPLIKFFARTKSKIFFKN